METSARNWNFKQILNLLTGSALTKDWKYNVLRITWLEFLFFFFFLLFNHSFHSLLSRKDSRCQLSLLNIQLCRISPLPSCCWQEKIGMFKRIMRFLIYYEYVTKCLPDAYYTLNPNQIVLNEVLRLQGTPCDTLWRIQKSAWISLCCCIW